MTGLMEILETGEAERLATGLVFTDTPWVGWTWPSAFSLTSPFLTVMSLPPR